VTTFPTHPGPRATTEIAWVELPTQGRAERAHLYDWIVKEESYVAGKFDDQRAGHDDSMKEEHLSADGFWFRQIVQYYDRARIAFRVAAEMREKANNTMTDHEARSKAQRQARYMEMKGQQALAKAMMTSKGCVESSIRCFGPLPKPGLSSGDVEEWA
jgi:hypothetical protein